MRFVLGPEPDLSQWEVRNHVKREHERRRWELTPSVKRRYDYCWECYGSFIDSSGPVPHAPSCSRRSQRFYSDREQDHHASLRDLEAPFPVDDHWLAEDKRRRLLKGSGIPGLSVKNELGEEF